MIRRVFFAVALFVAMGMAPCAHADTKPVRLVVPVPPGGSLDATARLIAQRWQARGTTVVVENRPGANTLIGSDAVAHSAPDGYTLLLGSTTLAIAPFQQKTAFNPESIAPVIQVSTETFALLASKSSGIDSPQALMHLAASRTGGINCISVPGAPEIACEQLKQLLGGRSTPIPYQGLAPATTALLGGHGDIMFAPMATAMQIVRGDQARLVAVSSRAAMPDDIGPVPLTGDVWKGFVLEGFTGIFVPAGTSEERVKLLNRELDAILHEPEVRAAMLANVQAPVGGAADLLEQQLQHTQARYHDVLVRLNLVPR